MSQFFNSLSEPAIARLLNDGAIGVVPTDTQYGVVCSVSYPESVERVFDIKGRDGHKPCIVIAGSLDQLMEMPGLDHNTLLLAEKYWPGAVSVEVPCQARQLAYLHRGAKHFACRIPGKEDLRSLLMQTGPLIAPSANPQEVPPAGGLEAAKSFFGDKIDFYVDGGDLSGRPPSTVIRFDEDGLVEVMRQGAVQIDQPAD